MNAEPTTQLPAIPPLSSSDLLAALREYEQKHPAFMRIPHLRLFCDGSGALIVHDVEMFQFHNLDDLMEKLKAANAELSDGAGEKR